VQVEAGVRAPTAACESITFSELIALLKEHYLAERGRSLTDSTVTGYLKALTRVEHRWGALIVARTRLREIDEWILEMQKEGLATATIRNALNQVAALFRLAVRRDLLPQPPCAVPRPTVIVRSVRDRVSEEDLDRLLEQAAAERDPAAMTIILLAADAGLRRSEIARLRACDIHRQSLHVAVLGQSWRTKSGRGRDVPILTERLRATLATSAGKGEASVISPGLDAAGVTKRVSVVWQLALQRQPSLHRLRHRWASQLADSGKVTPMQLMAWGGWRTLGVAQRYFHHDGRGPEKGLSRVLEKKDWGISGARARNARSESSV